MRTPQWPATKPAGVTDPIPKKHQVKKELEQLTLGFLEKFEGKENLQVEFEFPDEDMYPSSCQPKPDILDSFLQNTMRSCYPPVSQGGEYCALPLERERYMPVQCNLSPPNHGHHDSMATQPLPNQWEEVNVRDVDLKELQDVAEDLIKSEAAAHQLQQSRLGDAGQQAGPQEVISYLPLQVKQESVDAFERHQYSPYLDSSASEAGFRSGSEQSPVHDQSVRKERRREQNRRAARKCREKKKRCQDSLVQNYEGLRGENNRLKDEVDQLRQDMASLAELLRKHESTCPFAHTLPQVPARHLPAHSQTGAKRLQQAGKYLQSQR